MATIVNFDGLLIDSSELLSFTYNREFQINTLNTVNDKVLTQPGNLSPITFTFDVRITSGAAIKFFQWRNKLQQKVLAALVFSGDDYGGFYLSRLNIQSNNLDDVMDVLIFDMKLEFIQNQNFNQL
jgi:hypothetical protein